MAAEVLKKKIQELMKERDDALEKGDELERELNAMKEELLKVRSKFMSITWRILFSINKSKFSRK